MYNISTVKTLKSISEVYDKQFVMYVDKKLIRKDFSDCFYTFSEKSYLFLELT